MIIVGEKINTSRRSIAEAVEKRDAEFICKMARDQLMSTLELFWTKRLIASPG